ncbi:hypothetical protein BDZ90DRAFT_223817 [Jaminaea rosea]|uniref:NADH dehydrogenase [ubiquinone] 1 alpha subcomplex subunit 1 n=1 Tax=Jaminaea rosea TaxID=1569628 RepID=A0A316ULF0_9BASI|nr:hypothetical protein BDZ90DRAFT_223817 [Jaminaea rosea]PWN25211.1 hypothetical protein BDZ90DRAFT_223817 [Jaminaea rosea]
MPVPFEALIPMGLVGVMFFTTGTAYKGLKMIRNDGKPQRSNIDNFDVMMMNRDERLTGSQRGQSMEAIAPKEFATNSAWSTEKVG